jgi:hypothetical protein
MMRDQSRYQFISSLIVDVLFTEGNYRYYVLYIPSLIVLGFSWVAIISIFFFLDQGMVIQTDTFVATMPFDISHKLSCQTVEVINSLSGAFLFFWEIFTIWLLISIILDILYKIMRLYWRIWPPKKKEVTDGI